MTLLEIVNRVLIKLRQSSVTTVNETEYSRLVTEFVNETRREIEDAWNWLGLRATSTIETVADATEYVLTGVGNSRFKVLSVINDTEDYELSPINSGEMTKKFLFGDLVTGNPTYYSFNGFDVNGDPIVDIYPIPTDAQVIRFNLVTPQNDVLTDDVEIKVPTHIVILGSYVKALAEKGEESSNAYNVANAQYVGAMSSNIAQEEALLPGETDFYAI